MDNTEESKPRLPKSGRPSRRSKASKISHSVSAQVTGCILAYNEEDRIEGAIQCLQGWCVQIIVIDNSSTDSTAAIARRLGALVISAPRVTNFDPLRALAIEHAIGDWLYFLDCDERVPPHLVPVLLKLIEERGHEISCVTIPFKSYFCGKWMQHCTWWPGYTRPQLLKRGKFSYGKRLHSGVVVDGPGILLPADEHLAIDHFTYKDLDDWIARANNYTDGEAENLFEDGVNHSWQSMLAHFMQDWWLYYTHGKANLDGMHGFVLAFMSAFYRFAARAKLWQMRYSKGEANEQEPVPASVAEMLSFMTHVSRDREGTARLLQTPYGRRSAAAEMPTSWLSPAEKAATASGLPTNLNHKLTGVILAFNEETRIEGAIQSLLQFCDQVIVIDNSSTDATAEISRRLGALVISAPRTSKFEALRNLAIEHAIGEWLFFLDADERVPSDLGPVLRRLIHERGDEFEALCLPFKNHYYGKWMQSPNWWPGYKGPQLYKKGRFQYGARVHSSARVDGKVLNFPADDAALAIDHFAYEDIRRYLEKLNLYTRLEAEIMLEDGAAHSWQAMLAHFVYDWQVHYDTLQAKRDGMHGFVQSFLCSFYRFGSRAKLWNLRREAGETSPDEPVPASLEEMLAFMGQVLGEGAGPWLAAAVPVPGSGSTRQRPLRWKGPLFDASGFASDGRDLVLSLLQAGVVVELVAESWGPEVGIPEADRALLNSCIADISNEPADIQVFNTVPALLNKVDAEGFRIARTVFETSGLPPGWAAMINSMDRVWVHSKHNLDAFTRSGVDPEKIVIIPESIDAAQYAAGDTLWPLPGIEEFKFLSVFDFKLHKGWDLLVEAFARVFGGDTTVGLFIKTWSSEGYTLADIHAMVDAHLRITVGRGLNELSNIHIWQESLSAADMPSLYRAADCYLAVSRCEGWCRPLMEAMSVGLITIATAWGGQTDYHNADVGYPLKYVLTEVSEAAAREVPIYAGQYWAEPSRSDLQRLLKHVVKHREAAKEKGRAAQRLIASKYDRRAVGQVFRDELALCRTMANEKQRTTRPAARADSKTAAPNAILIQSASDDQMDLLTISRSLHEAYSRKHSMDYVCRLGPQQNERAAAWDKILLILQALRMGKWEYAIWLDADALIVDAARDLRAALPADSWLGMTRQGQPAWFNCGAMYIRSCPRALAFFEEVWRIWTVDHAWEENIAIMRVLGYAPERWQGVSVIGDEWNSARPISDVKSAVVRAWHGAGPSSARAGLMRRELQMLQGSAPPAAISPPLRLPSNPLRLETPNSVNLIDLLGRKLRVLWEGDFEVLSSLSNINRELCLGLIAQDDVELCIRWRGNLWASESVRNDPRFAALFACTKELSGPPDITVRHAFPPDWRKVTAGKLIVIQPWEKSHLPEHEWVDGAINNADAVMANSRFVRDSYVRSGVPAEKIFLLPHGVRTDVFTPDGPEFPIPTKKGTRFLFVGGTIPRKGADILLRCYLSGFTRDDDVCLIWKDMGGKTFYQGQNIADAIRQAQDYPNSPEIHYIDQDLTEIQLAALYRTATSVILPARGEGFGLSPFEGMASGRVPIVTAGSAMDDYVADGFGLRVPSRKIPVKSLLNNPNVLPFPYTELEPDMGALIDAMRWVYQNPEEAKQRGAMAREFILDGWTWERSVGILRERMRELVSPTVPKPSPAPRLWKPPTGLKRKRRMKASKDILISLCIIARDEAARIKFALTSIAPYVDEMIVLDTGSKDKTREIAWSLGARVYEAEWEDDFAESRNKSIRLARGRYIYWMDCDDVITPECGEMLRNLVLSHPNLDAAFQVQVRIPPGPNEFSPTVVDHIKLFPNRPDVVFEHRVHVQVLPSLRRADIEVHFSEVYVTHEHYDRSPEGQAKKRKRDFRLLELDLLDRPGHPFTLFNLGMTYLFASREYEVAAQYLDRSIQGSHWKDSIVRKAYALSTTCRVCQQDWQAAIVVNEAGRKHYPDDAELLFQAGQVYQNLNRLRDARTSLDRLINGSEGPHYRSVDVGLRTYRGLHELALLHRRVGEVDECVHVLERLVQQYPHYTPARQDLAATLAAHGRGDEAQLLMGERLGASNAGSAPAVTPADPNQLNGAADVWIEDCVVGTGIRLPSEPLRAKRCIATVASKDYSGMLDDMLTSLSANGKCDDCLRVVFSVDDDRNCADVAARHSATLVSCHFRGRLEPSVKSILYSVALAVEAEQYLCLDADMLIAGDLNPVFAALESSESRSILICRDTKLANGTLGGELLGFYRGNLEDIPYIIGASSDAGRYSLVVNDGMFAGSRAAMLALDSTLRSWLPRSREWLGRSPAHGCSNQFLLNLALAYLECGVPLDGKFNVQVQAQEVKISETDGRVTTVDRGTPVHILHFCGTGRGLQPIMKERLNAARKAKGAHPLHDVDMAICTVNREGDYIYEQLETMRPQKRVDLFVGSLESEYLRQYRSHPHIHINITSEEDWGRICSQDIKQRSSWNYLRCLAPSADRAKGLAVFEDDVKFAKGWEKRLARTIREVEAIHGNNFALSLYCAYPFVIEPYNKGELFTRYPLEVFAGTQGMYFPAGVRDGFRAYLKTHGVDSFRTNFDMLLREYLEQNEIPTYVTAPSLVQHIGLVTTGLSEVRHYSPLFLEEVE